MDEINKIKKAYNFQEKSINEIANKLNRSWATINKYVKHRFLQNTKTT